MTKKELLVNEIQKCLDEHNFCATVYDCLMLPVIEIEINWGDWKHDHLHLKWLMEEHFSNKLEYVGEKVTEEDGSDCYSAIHYFKIKRGV